MSTTDRFIDRAPVDRALLSLYLRDHLAGATAGTQRLRRMARANTGTAIGRPLTELATEIARDRAAVLAVMDRLGARRGRMRSALAALGERAGRLKTNRRLIRPSPLTPLLETELARSAVAGKKGLWQSLSVRADELGFDAAEFDRLIARADRQLAVLDRVHAMVRGPALSGRAPHGQPRPR